jgi:hypothetical protein
MKRRGNPKPVGRSLQRWIWGRVFERAQGPVGASRPSHSHQQSDGPMSKPDAWLARSLAALVMVGSCPSPNTTLVANYPGLQRLKLD